MKGRTVRYLTRDGEALVTVPEDELDLAMPVVLSQYREGDRPKRFSGFKYQDAFQAALCKVDSRLGGYVELVDAQGQVVRRHPERKIAQTMKGAGDG